MSTLNRNTGLKTLRNLHIVTQLGGASIQTELCVTEATVLCFFLTFRQPAKLEVIFLAPLTFQTSKTDRPRNVHRSLYQSH